MLIREHVEDREYELLDTVHSMRSCLILAVEDH